MLFTPVIPADHAGKRAALYDGAILRFSGLAPARALARDVRAQVETAVGHDPLHIHTRAGFDDIYPQLTALRQRMGDAPASRTAMQAVMQAAGFDPADYVLDRLRLRCVMHNGHLNAGAGKAYALHRDTWYGNPQSQINFWIPLHDVDARMAFMFFPPYFRRAIANTSHGFDFRAWVTRVGWQGSKNVVDNDYPRAIAQPDEDGIGFDAQAGDVIAFSASHLHAPVPNASGITRYSLDFRAVHRDDHAAGRGAPNVDNGSAPDAMLDYS